MSESYYYNIDISKAVRPGRATVSDFRLSVFLKHRDTDTRTNLLTVTHPETGNKFTLSLCGAVIAYDANGNRVDANTLTPDQAEALDCGKSGLDIVNNPWFEWISEDGSTVGEPFCAIHMNAEEEVEEMLSELGIKYVAKAATA